MKIKLNNKGFAAIRKSPRVKADLARRARQVATVAGPGFEAQAGDSRRRARQTVGPQTSSALRRLRENPNILIRALSAGR